MTTTTSNRKSTSAKNLTVPKVPVPDKMIEKMSDVLKMMADKVRLKILLALAKDGQAHVSALCKLVGQSQPAVSHHLTLMRMTGIVGYDRRGKENHYYLNSEFLGDLLEQFFASSGNLEQQIDLNEFTLSYKRQ